MEQIKSQVEFLQRLYLLNETVKSVAERAEVWAKEEGRSIPFQRRLMWSPLAQRVVKDLIFEFWDAARILWKYTLDTDLSGFQHLEDLSERSLESQNGDSGGHATNFNAMDLNTLELAVRILLQIVDNAFQNSLFKLPWSETEDDLDFVTVSLRLLDNKIENMLYWLGEILDDLGKIMPSDVISLAARAPRQKRTTLIERGQKGTRARA
jgi:hypothetical protein